MARPTRDVRRRTFNIGQLGSGDWVLFAATFALFIALIVNWWTGGSGAVNSVRFSEIYFVAMLILILATIALITYPVIQSEVNLRPLPFATPPIMILIGLIIFCATVYECGRYQGVAQTTVSPGFGIYLALICAVVYLVGALIKWGSRERGVGI